jgi:pyridoxine 5-phosphate synthase
MTCLSVNVNKLATLRNSREKNLPDVTLFARKILGYGAHGITVHPRPDGRHIRMADVWSLRELISAWPDPEIEFNIEGYPSEDFLQLIEGVRPDQATLVPDPPEALTSNAGWKLSAAESQLRPVLQRLHAAGTRVSLFVDPYQFSPEDEHALARLKPGRIELYTEKFSDEYSGPRRDEVMREYKRVSEIARRLGTGVNAGHDLNQQNLGYLIREIPWIDEVSIGHALICEALEQGMETTVCNYLRILEQADADHPRPARS